MMSASKKICQREAPVVNQIFVASMNGSLCSQKCPLAFPLTATSLNDLRNLCT